MSRRRNIAIAVRVLAVLAAIYAFFAMRGQVNQRSARSGPIPIQVVPATDCGSVRVEKAAEKGSAPSFESPVLGRALESPGIEVKSHDSSECEKLERLNGTIISWNDANYKIVFTARST